MKWLVGQFITQSPVVFGTWLHIAQIGGVVMVAVLFASLAFLLAACGANNENLKINSTSKDAVQSASQKQFGNAVDSVEIPQTQVEDQFQVGFCWAYSIAGLIESDYKFRTNKTLQISEEALGYYRMLEGLYFWMQNLSGAELNEAITTDSFQGWVLKDDQMPDTFDLVKKYGVVPESAWSKKFTSDVEVERMVQVIRKQAALLLLENFDPTTISRETIARKVLLAPGAWTSAPPLRFLVGAKAFTPKSYLASLEFDPDAFSSVVANKPSDLDAIISATKRSLVRGISVPFGYPVNMDLLKGDTFSGKGQDLNDQDVFFKDGGHAVLIDDFVNIGSSEGALPLAKLALEFLKPSKDLSYFVFKNSWGVDAKSTSVNLGQSRSTSGFYKIDREYLQGSANLTKLAEFKGILEVVVSNDIALDPFGKETVNPKVAQ